MDFILENFSVRYVNMFGFLVVFIYFLTGCYSLRLFYFVICGGFNSVSSYSMVETSYNMVFGMVGLLVMSIFGGSSLTWLICPTPSVICVPYRLKFLTLLVVFIGGWVGYEVAGFVVGYSLFSMCW
jgi:NADH-ubiquinone oxidoreductase chain 5